MISKINQPIEPKEAAELLKVDVRTVYQLMRQGRLRHTRLRKEPESWRTTERWVYDFMAMSSQGQAAPIKDKKTHRVFIPFRELYGKKSSRKTNCQRTDQAAS